MTTTITPEQADTLPAEAIELLPCPFCGGEASIVRQDVEPQGDPWYGKKLETFVRCTRCGTCLFDTYFHEGFADKTSAIAAWNRRAAVPSEQEPVAWVHNLTKIVRFDKPSIGLKDGDYTPLHAHPAPAAGVKVKALEWVKRDGQDTWDAASALGSYRLDDAFQYQTAAGLRIMLPTWRSPFHTAPEKSVSLDEAKAAAQADYEARILSALDTGEPK